MDEITLPGVKGTPSNMHVTNVVIATSVGDVYMSNVEVATMYILLTRQLLNLGHKLAFLCMQRHSWQNWNQRAPSNNSFMHEDATPQYHMRIRTCNFRNLMFHKHL